ncbi:MAG TPA: TonB-dependent receptor [Sediminispirochaeta sp.]|nr:TonB-dependent receptor [Sediminispirochaeta sp.]
MHKLLSRFAKLLLASALAVFCIPTATAEDPVDVLITAGRVKETEMNTPAHVTVLSGEEIRASGESSLVGVLEVLAGLNFSSYAGPESAQIDMRGFGENSHGRVLVMLDGRRLNSQDMEGVQWLSIPIDSIERVEVVRGSSSVLYGNHAVGGVVNIITKESRAQSELSSTLDFGAYYSEKFNRALFSSQRLRIGGARELVNGAFSFSHTTNSGYRDRSATGSLNTHLSGGWDATELLRAELDLGYQRNSYEMPGALPEEDYLDDPSAAVKPADEAQEHDLTAFAGLSWFPTLNAELSVDGGYRYQMKAIDMASWFSYTDRIYHSLEGSTKLTIEGQSGEFPWRIVGGADLYRSAATIVTYSDESREEKSHTAGLELSTIGGYIHPTVDLSSAFKIEGGLRYDYARVAGENDASDVDGSADHHALVYDGALLFSPGEGLKLYAKAGTLFRYPFTDEQAAVAGFGDGFNTELDPETGWSAEAGATLVLEDILTLRANGYYLEMNDEIAYDPGSPSYNSNLDQTRRWGADLELEARLHRMLGLTAAYGFVDARFAEGDDEGKRIPLVPAHSLDAGLDIKPVSGLSIKPRASFRGEAFMSGDEANAADPLDAYWLFDLELVYSPRVGRGDMRIRLKAENILDELYSTFAADYGTAEYYPAPGRSLSLSLAYSY